jgi:hypothetical protein
MGRRRSRSLPTSGFHKRREYEHAWTVWDLWYLRQIAQGLFLGSLCKLALLSDFAEPYASAGGAAVGVVTVLAFELLARIIRLNRTAPPIWAVAFACFWPIGAAGGGGFHLGSGPFSCWMYMALSGICWIGTWKEPHR